MIDTNPAGGIVRLKARYADVEKLTADVPDDPRFETVERDIQSDIREVFGEESTENTHHWSHRIFHSDQPEYLSMEPDDPYVIRRAQAGRKEGLKRTKVLLESLIKRLEERIIEQTASAPSTALRDARAAFGQLAIHPRILAACHKQFQDGHYREAILNAGIALVEYVKERANSPTDKNGKPLDGTPLMQQVFNANAPILKVNDLKTPTDQDEQQGMMFLFSGAALGLRNPRAHALDPDTAEYAVEAIAFLSFLAKVAQTAKI
jgi:uncharacterized protein (TIGR02391 family)